ncbi:MAG: 30S ribosomal protein S16 [Acidobacteria bacterium]|nr:MAG: 30S ribosomal protein S16 [Acidobacteriota bacterium]
MLAIKLMRMGAKKRPFYRIVVAEKRSRRDGRFVEMLGYYDPGKDPAEIKIDQERVQFWMQRGAQPTDTVRQLLRRHERATP